MHDYDEAKEGTCIEYELIINTNLLFIKNISLFPNDNIENYDKLSVFGYALIVDIDYPEYLQPLH